MAGDGGPTRPIGVDGLRAAVKLARSRRRDHEAAALAAVLAGEPLAGGAWVAGLLARALPAGTTWTDALDLVECSLSRMPVGAVAKWLVDGRGAYARAQRDVSALRYPVPETTHPSVRKTKEMTR